MDRQMFAPQIDVLAPEFRVISWDERGFGETEFDGQPFTYWDSARDCLGLLDHRERADELCRGLSGCAGVVRIEGASHASNLTHPVEVNGPLLSFLRSL